MFKWATLTVYLFLRRQNFLSQAKISKSSIVNLKLLIYHTFQVESSTQTKSTTRVWMPSIVCRWRHSWINNFSAFTVAFLPKSTPSTTYGGWVYASFSFFTSKCHHAITIFKSRLFAIILSPFSNTQKMKSK